MAWSPDIPDVSSGFLQPPQSWKLGWFLSDFGYDSELFGNDEIEDEKLVDLWGVVKVSEVTVHGMSLINFDAFAPGARWEELSMFADSEHRGSVSRQKGGAA